MAQCVAQVRVRLASADRHQHTRGELQGGRVRVPVSAHIAAGRSLCALFLLLASIIIIIILVIVIVVCIRLSAVSAHVLATQAGVEQRDACRMRHGQSDVRSLRSHLHHSGRAREHRTRSRAAQVRHRRDQVTTIFMQYITLIKHID